MNVRENLVERLRWWSNECDRTNFGCQASELLVAAANYIANGVTVQEWISVNDERKPKEGEDVLVAVFDGYDTYTDIDCLARDGKWCFETENYKVTHWMKSPSR